MGSSVDSSTLTPQQNEIGEPPKLRKVETFEEKLYRKFTSEPLVPFGCLVTAYFLGSGINSFFNRDAARSQRMMRARVGAQFATLLVFMGYAGMNSIDFNVAPMYQASQQMRRQQDSSEQNGR
mmetsp:Transcript_8068/g.9226  ORF Transcript_8068/g.9226 Transcript_8068/m.9226 type:complete len:123 (+) Transcript_8068:74-442(+)|eukprot:CAMPEP_0194145268 /NCGR_PEP_ID=MMETSP0152-20130528/16064_1 /TAXON_ID=1049557 /ORGANISM="Thalassiothrix antarctica, Strain L6-D1" /LENGTH=122 /DNA_ID=CAMNT_0038845411 /DNA_START=74 /DNA_END=442 /DNA_ORIENTATION=+